MDIFLSPGLSVQNMCLNVCIPGKWQASVTKQHDFKIHEAISVFYDAYFMVASVPMLQLRMHDITAHIYVRSFDTENA